MDTGKTSYKCKCLLMICKQIVLNNKDEGGKSTLFITLNKDLSSMLLIFNCISFVLSFLLFSLSMCVSVFGIGGW